MKNWSNATLTCLAMKMWMRHFTPNRIGKQPNIRKKIENHFDKFDLFLILYQGKYIATEGNKEKVIDNDKYFGDLMKRASGVNWKVVEHPNGWDGGSKYIIGSRQ